MQKEGKVYIINKLGLHARAAAKFVDCAAQFSSEIELHSQNTSANGKSIMSILMLAAGRGTEITLITRGKDADRAYHALESLIADRFEEAE